MIISYIGGIGSGKPRTLTYKIYMIEFEKINYVGITKNIRKRMIQHLHFNCKTTTKFLSHPNLYGYPLMVYYNDLKIFDFNKAREYETKFKKNNRERKFKLIDNWNMVKWDIITKDKRGGYRG